MRKLRTEPTQEEKILAKLKLHPGKYVCGTHFLEMFIYTYAQRISQLNDKGWEIVSTPCRHPQHSHAGLIAAYKLVIPPAVSVFQ